MASIEKRPGGGYLVRWRDPGGRAGAQRSRVVPDLDTARRLRTEVERLAALGDRWEAADVRALPALLEIEADDDGGHRVTGGLFADFLAARRGRLSPGTRRHYDRALRRFFVWLADRHPKARRLTVEHLSRDGLEAWFGSLVDDRQAHPLGISTARLAVTAVWAAWEWAWDSDTYGDHVSRPRRPDLPVPITTPAAAPTWEHMDAAIGAAWTLAETARTATEREGWTWRARLCTFLRYTGLRVDEQALQLRWDDVDLDRCLLVIRGELGKSSRERSGREVPLSPELARLMAGWGRREGLLIAPHLSHRHSDPRHMLRIWESARVRAADGTLVPVPLRAWGVGPGRSKAQPHHAFRKGFKTGLAALGVASDVRDFLVGHHRGIDEHYLDTIDQARAAVARIPPLSELARPARVAEVVRLGER